MRVAWRTSLLLVVLAVVLNGCGKAGSPGGKAGPAKGGDQTKPSAAGTSASATAGSSECVVGVNEMA